MTAFLILLSLVTIVAGHLLLKLGVNRSAASKRGVPGRRPVVWVFAAAISSMTISFFLSLGLLQKLDLSYLFPFQDLSIILIAFCSAFFLKERLSPALITGVLLVTAGVILVSSS